MPTAYLNRRWISKFLVKKNHFQKIVVDSFNIAQNRNYYFRFWRSKAEGMLHENFCFIVICFLQAIIELWKSHDRLHGIPGDDLARASRKGVENPCREKAIHRIPLMPASMTACWKCAFRFPVLGSASGRRTHRKSWSDWNFWSDESKNISKKIRRTS